MSDERIAEIQRRLEDAVPDGFHYRANVSITPDNAAMSMFIFQAPDDISYLLAEVQRLRAIEGAAARVDRIVWHMKDPEHSRLPERLRVAMSDLHRALGAEGA